MKTTENERTAVNCATLRFRCQIGIVYPHNQDLDLAVELALVILCGRDLFE